MLKSGLLSLAVLGFGLFIVPPVEAASGVWASGVSSSQVRVGWADRD